MTSIKPKLGVIDLSMILLSLVIGIGIFRTPSIVAQQAGSPAFFFLAWILGGLISLCGALTFAEIGGRYAVPGGFYKVFSYCYHPAFALMMTWVLLLTMGASFATVALIGVEYFSPILLPASYQNPQSAQFLAAGLIILLTFINFMGIRSGANTQNILSVLKILLILIICFAAFSSEPASRQIKPSGDSNWWNAIGLALISVLFSYSGYQQTINFGGDVSNPNRNIPKAILIGIGLILGLYILLNMAYYYVLGFEGILSSPLVAATAGEAVYGKTGNLFISIVIFISVMGLLNANLMAIPRMYYAMAEDKVLPPIFKRVNSKTQVQEFALCFFACVSLISLFSLKTFENLLNYVMFIESLALATAASAVFIFRRRAKNKDPYAGFRVPLYPLIPALFVICLLGISINVMISETTLALWGSGLFLLGYPLYRIMRKLYPEH